MSSINHFYTSSNYTCSETKAWSDVIMGECNNPSVSHGGWMTCFRLSYGEGKEADVLSPDANGTVYRCGCNRLFPLDGPECNHPSYYIDYTAQWVFSLSVFSILCLVSCYQSILAFRAVHTLLAIARAQKKTLRKQFDTVCVTAIMLAFAGSSAALMIYSFIMRIAGVNDNAEFDGLLWAFPICVMFSCQSLNGLALAWLDVAIKSDKVSGGQNIKKYTAIKWFLKGFMLVMFIGTVFLMASDNSSMISLAATMMSFVMSIALRIGGGKIRKMLMNAGSDAKSTNVADAMKHAYTYTTICTPALVLLSGFYTVAYIAVTWTAERGDWIIVTCVPGMVICLQVTNHAIITFIYKVRVASSTAKVAASSSSDSSSNARRKSTMVSKTSEVSSPKASPPGLSGRTVSKSTSTMMST